MASETKKTVCTLCDKIGLKPITKENVCNFYIPIHGVISYGALAVNVMNPSLIAKRDMTNVLLVSSIIGSSFYIYGRPHLKNVENVKRGAHSLLIGSLFSMGSVLGWALLKSVLPKDNNALAAVAGLATGAIIVKLGTDYVKECDSFATN